MTSYLFPIHVIYLVATVGLCGWLARTLYRNGETFLADVFEDRPEVARAVNRLLVTGFAMFELGFGLAILGGGTADEPAAALEILAHELGGLLLSLAVVHFATILVFHLISEGRRRGDAPAPVARQPWGRAYGPPPAGRPNPPAPAPHPTVG